MIDLSELRSDYTTQQKLHFYMCCEIYKCYAVTVPESLKMINDFSNSLYIELLKDFTPTEITAHVNYATKKLLFSLQNPSSEV